MLDAAQKIASTSAPVLPAAASALRQASAPISAISDSWSSPRSWNLGRMRAGSSTPSFSMT